MRARVNDGEGHGMAELTMRVKAWYGDEVVSLPIPDTWNVQTSRLPDTMALAPDALASAVDAPVGSRGLRELASGAGSVAIIVEDMKRPTPVAEIVPVLLERLHAAGLDEDSIRFVLALGCHRQAPREELVKNLGKDIVCRYGLSLTFRELDRPRPAEAVAHPLVKRM